MTAHTTTLPALRLRFVRHSDRIEIWFGEEYRNLYKVKYKHIYRALAAQVSAEGRPELAEKYAPGDTATLAQIEAAISDLRNEALGPINPYVLPTD